MKKTVLEEKAAYAFRQLGFDVKGFVVDMQKQKPTFVMPTCPESGKPVNQCRCDKCPIPF